MPPLVSAKGWLLAELRDLLASEPREAWPAVLERGLREVFEISGRSCEPAS
ncbi:hypothetical protein ACFSC4_15620 [Deinococcus malanensis]|uniref:hypothetical protein n=1 Tax=Deinococcus malanensis TaxID=1706855 RepID=UPI003624ADBF